jgi:hypothetical protein
MRFIPIPGFPQPPAVDDIADEIKVVAAALPQEIGKEIAAAISGSKMHIGDKDGSVAVGWPVSFD